MIPFLAVMLSAITLNVNGLHDQKKWGDLWCNLPKVDLICLQEIYLVPSQLYAFKLYVQKYDCFSSECSSNSAGVAIGVRQSSGIIVHKVGEIQGRLLALNLSGPENM